MITISKGHKLLGTLLFSTCLLIATDGLAHRHGGWGGGGHHDWDGGGWGGGGGAVYIDTDYSPGFYDNCGVVGGFWRHGYWVPEHRECWY